MGHCKRGRIVRQCSGSAKNGRRGWLTQAATTHGNVVSVTGATAYNPPPMNKPKQAPPATIAVNRKARHEYQLGDIFEAGLVLQGWEVKAMRAGKCNLSDAYVTVRNGEVFLFGCQIQPLQTASTHIHPDPLRTRKLLLKDREISQIMSAVTREGETCIPLKLYWSNGLAKCEIAVAKGKKLHDKRESEKERDWDRERQRLMRTRNKG